MMRVLLIGGTGKVGRPILRELVGRGHEVTVLVRDPAPLAGDGFRNALAELRERAPAGLRWTVVSAAVAIQVDGPRTGTYRIATDILIERPDGSSAISAADLAVAVADEAERAGHVRARFTMGY